MERSLVLDLKFNEGVGTIAHDVSGNRNHVDFLAPPNDPVWGVEGGINHLIFDGDDYVLVGDDPTLDIAGDLSIEIEIMFNAELVPYAAQPIRKWTGTPDANYVMYFFGQGAAELNRDVGFYANVGGSWNLISDRYKVTIGVWYLIALSYDTVLSGQLYINGSPYGVRGDGTGALYTNAIDLHLGNGAECKIRRASIWNKALTDEEAALRYAQRRRV